MCEGRVDIGLIRSLETCPSLSYREVLNVEKALSNRWMLALFIGPGLLLVLVFFLVPVLATFYYSLQEWDGVHPMLFIGFGNYAEMLNEDPAFWKAVVNGLVFIFASLFVQLPIAFLLALLLSRKWPGSKWFRNVYFFPVLMSTTMMSLLWGKIYDPSTGMLNAVLDSLGLHAWTQAWLGDSSTALVSVVAVVQWQYVGYYMLIMYAGLQSIPAQYYEAAKLDGATGWKAVRHITLPLLSDVLKINVVLSIIYSLKVFEHVYVMTNGGPVQSTTVMALRMFQEAFLKQNFGYGSALAIFLVAECVLIAWAVNKFMTREQLEF